MANRTVDSPWNAYSRKDWLEGWKQMQVPGTYERGIFGDLMIPGIACGIRKLLLIFNTNPESAHDPIYVVDPRQFNVQVDTSVPIILAYNQSHYESLHPCSNMDILESINLVKKYIEGRYRFSKKDFPLLLNLDKERPIQSKVKVTETCPSTSEINVGQNEHKPGNPSPISQKRKQPTKSQLEAKILDTEMGTNHMEVEITEDVILEEVDEYLDNFKKKKEGNFSSW